MKLIVMTFWFMTLLPAVAGAPVVFFQEPTTTERPGAEGVDPGSGLPSGVLGAGGSQTPTTRELREQFRERVLEMQRQAEQGESSGAGQPVPGQSGVVTPSAGGNAARASASDEVRSTGPGLLLNLSNTSIDRFVQTIMQELGLPYVIDPAVQGTVSIYTQKGRELPRERLFSVLEHVLKLNGAAIVKQGDFYSIVPIGQSPTLPHQVLMNKSEPRSAEEAAAAQSRQSERRPMSSQGRPEPAPEGTSEPESSSPSEEVPPESGQEDPSGTQPNPSQGEPQNPPQTTLAPELVETVGPQVVQVGAPAQLNEQGVITYIIPLNYIPSDEMLKMIQVFLSPGATVIDFASANMLLVTDYPGNIEQALTLVELLDTRYFSFNTLDLIPIRYNQAVDVAEDLAQIFAPGDQAAGVRIVAIERLNSILVVTHSADVFREVTKWIDKLDAPSSTSNLKTYVYQVENNTAVQISQILAELYQDGVGLPSSMTGDDYGAVDGRTTRDSRAGFGATQARSFDNASFVDSASQFGRASAYGGYGGGGYGGYGGAGGYGGFGAGGPRQLGPALSAASQSQIRAIYAGNVKIVVNEFNNSLIIQGTEADIQFILDTIRQLDTLPRQVLIEAKIYSVELRDDLNFGVSAFLQARGTAAGDEGAPATTGSMGISDDGTGTGLSLATRLMVGGEREVQALVSALKAETDVQILESPRVLVIDGTQATINIGAEVPVTSASYGNPLQSGSTNFVNSISYRPTGTTLGLVPRVSASGNVTMDVVLEVSTAAGQALTPTINRNYVQTSFIVGDGQAMSIAGLISDSHTVNRDRVPILGDIPILGALFGTTSKNDRRYELIIFITPRVIRGLPSATEMTLDFKRALRNAYDYVNQKEQEELELIERRRREELERARPEQR